MTYTNIIYRYGLKNFSSDFTGLIDGLILADLPVRMHKFLIERGLNIAIIPFATPLSRENDLKTIHNLSADFVYYIGVKGVTGSKNRINLNEQKIQIEKIKKITGKKVVYGFGIKNRKDADKIHEIADGFVIGTEIVKRQPYFDELKKYILETY